LKNGLDKFANNAAILAEVPFISQIEEPVCWGGPLFLRSITLKALANSSPGLRFGNPGINVRSEEGLAQGCENPSAPQLSELRRNKLRDHYPALPRRNPGLQFAKPFQR